MLKLESHQLDALHRIHTGCILCGGVGSGKSLTALSYYYLKNGGDKSSLYGEEVTLLKNPTPLYIITTARKRDEGDWIGEMSHLYLEATAIDSWNNITKYDGVSNAFFIFDEQRVVGTGVWSKTFIKIARKNDWILLSATPGDTWSDYIPVFIANGFYKNRTEFVNRHIVDDPHVKFPRVLRYLDTGILLKHRREILVDMDFDRKTIRHDSYELCDYDKTLYKIITKQRWNPYEEKPIESASELCYLWRRVVNSDESRLRAISRILKKHPRAIIFYNFNYELELLRGLKLGEDFKTAEWNGQQHDPLPSGPLSWAYFVQYTAGAEGWNCINTDAIVFFSANYSYKIMEQAKGRIDRLNTPYRDLYYYHLTSSAPIDLAIRKALSEKRTFNESRYVEWDS